MEPEAFEYALNSAYEYIYNNESELAPLQYPLAMSRYITPKFANDLYTDNANQYFTYSGTSNSLIVTKEKDGRYKNLTLRAYSGDSFKFYFQAGSGIADSDLYFSGPLTTSGVYSTMTQYATQSGALTNAITFSAPTNNSSVYTLPSVQNLNWIRLFHQSTNGTTPYRIYQFLPRTLIQVDDLEADVIDAVTIRVSDSIVIGPNLIGDKSILGQKIVDGTLSGILLTNGTITGNKVLAGTISGVLITAGTIKGSNIEALTISGSLITAEAITASKIAAGTITFDKIASNTLTSGQIANGTITGQNILAGTVSGVLITNNSITASNIAGATITGDKIVARTISGALITAGTIKGENIEALTISGSLITAGTITATKLNVTQLDAVAANMGTLTVNSGISIGTNGTIWAGAGTVASPTSGLKIYTTSGISRLTTYSGGVAQVDIASNGKLLAGAGAVILDSAGLTAGKTVVNSNGITVGTVTAPLDNGDALKIMASGASGNNGGISFYNGAYSAISPQATLTTDATNSFVLANNVPDGDIIIGTADTGNNTILLYNANVNIMPTVVADVGGLYGYSRTVSGEALKYLLNTDGLYLYDNIYDAGFNPVPNVILGRTTGDITAKGSINVGTTSFNKFTVAAATGNTAIAGTLGVTSTLTASANVLQYNYGGLYKNTAQNVAAGADAKITFQVAYTNGTLDSVANSRLTTAYAGFYVISAGVIGNQTGNTWQVVTGGAFGTGVLLAGIIQADMRAYVTKIVYLAAGTNLEIYVRNTGAAILAVTTGTTGTVLSAAKVG